MSKMIVRPPQFWANPFGNPAEDYNVYVGVPNYDPRQEQYQLAITDGVGGPIVSNPFKVNKGLAKNANGEIITPVINQQEYSLFFESPSGGGIEIAKFIGDGLSSNGGGSGGGIPDLTINNLDQALQTDLSAYNFVFIKSESSGWEGTANGPSIVSFYYRDGTTGAASSGDENKFFDLSGNGWSLAKSVTEKNLQEQIDNVVIDKGASLTDSLTFTAPETGLYEAFFTAFGGSNASGSNEISLSMTADSGSPSGFFTGLSQVGSGSPTTRIKTINGSTSDIISANVTSVGATLTYQGTAILSMSAGNTVTFEHESSGAASITGSYSSIRKASS